MFWSQWKKILWKHQRFYQINVAKSYTQTDYLLISIFIMYYFYTAWDMHLHIALFSLLVSKGWLFSYFLHLYIKFMKYRIHFWKLFFLYNFYQRKTFGLTSKCACLCTGCNGRSASLCFAVLCLCISAFLYIY